MSSTNLLIKVESAMSVGSQVTEALRKLSNERYEDAVIAASISLSATARLEYPTEGDKQACRRFLEDYLPIICKISWVSFGISQPINFRYRRLDGKLPGIAVRSMPEMLYDVVRCTAVHEAKLPGNLHFVKESIIKLGNDGELVLPVDLVYGLVLAVVSSTRNANQYVEGDPAFSFNGKSRKINEFWGNRPEVEKFIGIN